jgi:hypothetical protein
VTAVHLDLDDVFTAFLSWEEIAQQLREPMPSDSVKRRAMQHPEGRVRRCAAERLVSDPYVMTLAAADPHNEVRQVAAASRATSPEVLAAMVCDRSRVVREHVARNRNTPPHTLEQLSRDPAYEVRQVAASWVQSPTSLTSLSRDRNWQVRLQLAQRDDLPAPTSTTLAVDTMPQIRAAVAARPAPDAVYEMLMNDADEAVVRTLAANRRIPPQVTLALAAHDQTSVRRRVGRHTTTIAALAILADDPDVTVRLGVAMNPVLPLHLVVHMLNTRSKMLKRTLLMQYHQQLPDEVVGTLLEELLASPNSVDRTSLRQTFADRITPLPITEPPALTDRRGLFEVVDRCLPYELIAHAVLHPDTPATVVAGLMAHPLIPADVLTRLRRHPSSVVQSAHYTPRMRYVTP